MTDLGDWLVPRRKRVNLSSRLTPTECERRLSAHLVVWRYPKNLLIWPNEGSIQGRVSEQSFWISSYHRGFRNSFQTTARGSFISTERGTRIEMSMGVEPAVLFFILVIVGGVSFAAWSNSMFGVGSPGSALIPIGAILTYVIGRWASRNDAAAMLTLIQTELKAVPSSE